MRSTLHDIGPVLTHRTQIVRLALQGKTTSQICQIMHHSPEAVANYLSTFTRCAHWLARSFRSDKSPSSSAAVRPWSALISNSWPSAAAIATWRIISMSCSDWELVAAKKKPLAGGPPMSSTPDFIRKKFGPLREKTLKNALAHRIAVEFPRIGPRFCGLWPI